MIEKVKLRGKTVVIELKDENDYEVIAEEIVTEAIDSLLTEDEEYKDIANITPLKACKVRELSDDLEFCDLSQNINDILERIGISDLDNEVGSIYWEYCDGEIGQVWHLKSNVPGLNEVTYRIR